LQNRPWGTLDLELFHYPLRHLAPCTFNIALDLRTRVRLEPHVEGSVRVSSEGFDSAQYPLEAAPFDHPLGLVFAVAAYFRAGGVHIVIESSSPPRSALGGSSSAAVAVIASFSAAFQRLGARPLGRRQIALLAYSLEAQSARVPCGIQDQLAAVYGGVNAWHWPANPGRPRFEKETLAKGRDIPRLEERLLLAYCGMPHTSGDLNGRFIGQFAAGLHRQCWKEIILCANRFVEAIRRKCWEEAVEAMNRETSIRRHMIPEVLDPTMVLLVEAAVDRGCGARFAGAGGGGCVWAFGEPAPLQAVRGAWENILQTEPGAHMLDARIDRKGVVVRGHKRGR